MSQRQETPAPTPRPSGLIPAGGAKARTNAAGGTHIEEEFPLEPYDVP